MMVASIAKERKECIKDAQEKGEKQRAKWNVLGSTQSMENRVWVVRWARHSCFVLTTIEPTIIDIFLQHQESYFILFLIFNFKVCLGFCILVL
jgi:hypothetical protein